MNLTHLMERLKDMPLPIFTSVAIAVVGLLLASIWNPGYASLGLSSVSLGCIVGGLSLWSWIGLKTLHEQQTVKNYESRPLASNNPSCSKIVEWFHRTKLKSKREQRWVVQNGAVFLVGIVFLAVLLHSEYFVNKPYWIHAFSIGLYFYACILTPAYYMVDLK